MCAGEAEDRSNDTHERFICAWMVGALGGRMYGLPYVCLDKSHNTFRTQRA